VWWVEEIANPILLTCVVSWGNSKPNLALLVWWVEEIA
jgi:hypothetical protein